MSEKTIKMTEGPILSELIKYAVPIMLATIVQLLFNSADLAVVGNFSETGTAAAAAVGAASPITTLIINFFMGISIGVNILLARSIGANDKEKSEKFVHAALVLGTILGVVSAIIGICISRYAIIKTNCPSDAVEMAVQYLQIYFLGAPAMLIYNFSRAIMNTNGDTKRPLYFIVLAGVLNVGLNLLFVCVFKMEAMGVALATTITQYIPPIFAIYDFRRKQDFTHLDYKKLKFYKKETLEIIQYGLPLGITEVVTQFAGVQLQSALNSFDNSSLVNGVSIAGNIRGYFLSGVSALHAACVAFVGRNIGAKNIKRAIKCFLICIAADVTFGFVTGNGALLFAAPLIKLFNYNDPAVVVYGTEAAAIVWRWFFLTGIKSPLDAVLQAFGKSSLTTVYSITLSVGFQIFWINFIFPTNKTISFLYTCQPIATSMIVIAEAISLFFVIRKYLKSEKEKING